MKEFRFDSVRLLLAIADGRRRQELKKALAGQGFRQILDAADHAPALDVVVRNAVDVMVIDVDLPGGDACTLVDQLRHHKIGNNPFLVTLVLAGAPTEAVVRRVIDSGVDDLLVEPIGPDALIQRIKALARGRKPFVVTHDYIGPDRRHSPRAGGPNVTLVDVPNPLRSKAVANSDTKSLQRLIDTAAARINQQKMERHAVQIGYLAEQVARHFTDGRLTAREPGVLALIVDNLRRMAVVADDLGQRMRGTRHAHVAALALSLIGITERVIAAIAQPSGQPRDGGTLRSDVELVPKIALALSRAFDIEHDSVEAAHEISQSLQNFAQRHAEPAGDG